MKRTYTLKNLDCATCAALMEESIRRLPGVQDISISFMTCRMVLEAEDITPSLIADMRKAISKVDANTTF